MNSFSLLIDKVTAQNDGNKLGFYLSGGEEPVADSKEEEDREWK